MAASRSARLAYIWCSTPVRAQISRLTSASALRARWLITCPLVQPGSRLGPRTAASSSLSTAAVIASVATAVAAMPRLASSAGAVKSLSPDVVAVSSRVRPVHRAPYRPGHRGPIASARCTARGGLSVAAHSMEAPFVEAKGTGVADRLVVRGAREHNLRGVDLDLPRDSLIVFTGLSGSGKSSLAFDTIFAEGQRRYVESLSAYARQFLGQMDKPDVDFIEGLSPAVSIDQKSTSRNPRSTVGTITEVYDYLRLLYARAGTPHCPQCGRPIARQQPSQIVDKILELDEGSRFQVLAPVIRGRKGEYVDLFAELQAKGFSRVRVDGVVHSLTE